MLNIKKERNPKQSVTSISQSEMIYFSLKPKPKLEHQEEKQSYKKGVKCAEETINQISNLQTILNYFLSILLN